MLNVRKNNIFKSILFIMSFVIISNITFASVVSDNDGSAFITKAEFDSLKNNFQSQLDAFNLNIDNKIDDAIASYLAGITISKKKMVSTFYSPKEGAMSLKSSDLPWVEGNMDIKLYGSVARFSGYGQAKGVFDFTMSTSSKSTFKETLISDVDYSNGIGAFVGYYKTYQYLVGNGSSSGNFAFKQAGCTQVYGYYGGNRAISNQILTECDSPKYFSVGFGSNTYNPDYYANNILDFSGTQASFRRELVNNDSENWTGALILNKSSLSHKFNNFDEYRDWCNDSDDTGHTEALTFNAINLAGSGKTHKVIDNSYSTTNATILTNQYCTGSLSYGGDRIKPYLGFVSSATDWNGIYIKDYDSIISTIMPSSDGNYINNIIADSKGIGHLKLGAGLPVVSAKEKEKVTYEFDFKDKTKNYRVWVKEGSFNSNSDLWMERDNCIKSFTLDGDTTYNSTHCCLEIKNGKGKATWTMSKQAIVYLKWAEDGNVNDGGGILYPSDTVIIETEST